MLSHSALSLPRRQTTVPFPPCIFSARTRHVHQPFVSHSRMITRSQKTKQAPAECFVKTTRQRPRPIHSRPAPFKQPSTPASDPPLSDPAELPESRGRKRRRALELDHDRPAKRLRDQIPAPDPPPDHAPAIESALSPSFTHLTKKHLDELERLSGMSASNGISRAATSLGRGGKKRSLSRQSSAAEIEETLSNSSQRTSIQANYRWRNLDDARIVVEATDIPTNIGRLVDAIIQPYLSASRRSELALIAENICNDFSNVVRGKQGRRLSRTNSHYPNGNGQGPKVPVPEKSRYSLPLPHFIARLTHSLLD